MAESIAGTLLLTLVHSIALSDASANVLFSVSLALSL